MRESQRANTTPSGPPPTQPDHIGSLGMARHHGVYADTEIKTVDDVKRLLKAAETNNDACQYLDWINTQLQKGSTARTVGQQELVTRWSGFLAFNKERRNAARTEAGLPAATNESRKCRGRPASSGNASNPMEVDEALPGTAPSTAERDHHTWYATLLPAQQVYAGATPSQWPAGMCQDIGGVPTWVPPFAQQEWLAPWAGDTKAAMFSRGLAPQCRNHDSASNIRRQEFLRVFWSLWNTPGLYTHLATEIRLTPGNQPLEHFPFITNNITILTIVLWLLDHGVGPDSRMIPLLESYAQHTIRDQPLLAPLVTSRPIDEWIAELGSLLNAESHTLRYPLPVSAEWEQVTAVELQLRDRAFTGYHTAQDTVNPASTTTGPASGIQPSADTGRNPGASSAAMDDSADTASLVFIGPVLPPNTDVEMTSDKK